MILDYEDLKILREFNKLKVNEEIKALALMKRIFPKGGDKEYMLIRRKIERMTRDGLFRINGEKNKTYILDSNKVIVKKFSFPCGRKLGISILEQDRWEIFEL